MSSSNKQYQFLPNGLFRWSGKRMVLWKYL